jgi:AP-1 complex subunit sigma 1/2
LVHLIAQIRFVLLLSRQGKVRLAKWYTTISQKERAKIIKEVTALVLPRAPKLCNFVDWRDAKIVYRRYASLYFVCGIDQGAMLLFLFAPSYRLLHGET